MANRLALAAYSRALTLSPLCISWPHLTGLGLTSTIVSNYKRRGDYRAHCATVTARNYRTYSWTFCKGYRERHDEDLACGILAARAVAEAWGAEPTDIGVVLEEHESENAVGEKAAGVEAVPIADVSSHQSEFSVDVFFTRAQPTSVPLPPLPRLPSNTIIAIEDQVDTILAAILNLGLERTGEPNKSWTSPQPAVVLLRQPASTGFLYPDDSLAEDHTHVENWCVLRSPTSDPLAIVKKFPGTSPLLSSKQLVDILETPSGREALLLCQHIILTCTDYLRDLFDHEIISKIELAVPVMPIDMNDGSPSTMDASATICGSMNGFAVVRWDNGITYRGFLKDGMFNGYGQKMYSKGGGYQGAWVNSKRCGTGVSLFHGKFGNDRWIGNFVDDKPHGNGVMILENGEVVDFQYDMGSPLTN